MICPAHPGKEVHAEHTVKGYEMKKDRFVVIQQSELDTAAPKGGKAIKIQDFVELSQIDPLYFDRPYYIVPKPEGAKPFRLLMEAMQKTNRVAIAKVVLWGRENLAALRPLDDGMVLETMHFSDEVVPAASVPGREVHAKLDNREMKMALSLVDSLTSEFDPSRYHDDYRDKVLELIHKKAQARESVTRPTTEEQTPRSGHDLVAACKRVWRRPGTAPAAWPGRHGGPCATTRPRAEPPAEEVGMSTVQASLIKVGPRELRFTNLEKVLYPASRFTKGPVIDYYLRIAPTLLPHLKNHPITLKRYPNGVDKPFFYEKHARVIVPTG